MTNFFKLQGKLVYEPARTELRKTFKAKTLIVDLPFDDLANYYIAVVRKRYGIRLHPPMWGNHVTVVRGDERPKNPQAWKKHEGELVEFEVSPHLYKVWDFWALPVRSKRLYELRDELGLKAFHEMHVTIGRETDHDRKLWTRKQLGFLQDRPLFVPGQPEPKPAVDDKADLRARIRDKLLPKTQVTAPQPIALPSPVFPSATPAELERRRARLRSGLQAELNNITRSRK